MHKAMSFRNPDVYYDAMVKKGGDKSGSRRYRVQVFIAAEYNLF